MAGADLDLRDVLTILSVEMRWRVIRAVHVDHDPVERRKAGHLTIVRDGSAEVAALPDRSRWDSAVGMAATGARSEGVGFRRAVEA
jgi:hypothetical protein